MPISLDSVFVRDFNNLSEFDQYRITKPDYAIEYSHIKQYFEICRTYSHKIRIQYGKCALPAGQQSPVKRILRKKVVNFVPH